jgi:hypothetical protein
LGSKNSSLRQASYSENVVYYMVVSIRAACVNKKDPALPRQRSRDQPDLDALNKYLYGNQPTSHSRVSHGSHTHLRLSSAILSDRPVARNAGEYTPAAVRAPSAIMSEVSAHTPLTRCPAPQIDHVPILRRHPSKSPPHSGWLTARPFPGAENRINSRFTSAPSILRPAAIPCAADERVRPHLAPRFHAPGTAGALRLRPSPRPTVWRPQVDRKSGEHVAATQCAAAGLARINACRAAS